jgi:hypothetical protein
MNSGDLAWLPSNTALVSFEKEGDSNSGVTGWCYPKEPAHVLVLGEIDDTYFQIVYRGQKWAVPKNRVYRS